MTIFNSRLTGGAPVAGLAAALLLASGAAGQTTMIDKFDDGAAEGWNEIDLYEDSSYSVQAGRYEIRNDEVPPGTDSFALAYLAGGPDVSYHDGHITLSIIGEYYTDAWVVLRADVVTLSGYVFGVDLDHTGRIFIERIVNGQSIWRESGGTLVFPDREYMLRAGAVGSEFTLAVWEVGQHEPAVPQLSRRDSTVSGFSGVAIGVSDGGDIHGYPVIATFDNIGFAPATRVDDFNDGDAEGWIERDFYGEQGGTSYTVQAGRYRVETNEKINPPGSPAFATAWKQETGYRPELVNGTMHGSIVLNTDASNACLMQGDAETISGWAFCVSNLLDRLLIFRVTDGTPVPVATAPYPVETGVNYQVRGAMTGTLASLAVWRTLLDEEPETPQIAIDLDDGSYAELTQIGVVIYDQPEQHPGGFISASFDDIHFEQQRAPGDVNGDGLVRLDDLLSVLTAWGPGAGCLEDLDGDGAISFGDLLLVLQNWS